MSLQADRTGGRTIIGMEHFAGLDVSVKETSVCIVDDTGRIVREAKVASEPEALLAVVPIGNQILTYWWCNPVHPENLIRGGFAQ